MSLNCECSSHGCVPGFLGLESRDRTRAALPRMGESRLVKDPLNLLTNHPPKGCSTEMIVLEVGSLGKLSLQASKKGIMREKTFLFSVLKLASEG